MHLYQIKGVPKEKLFISQHMYLASGVEMVSLMIIFNVVKSAVGVHTSPVKLIKFTSTVIIFQCGFYFCGL